MRTYIQSILFFLMITAMASGQERQLIQVSTYHLTSEAKAKQFDSMMEAAVRIQKDNGANPIGVFKLAEPGDQEQFPHQRVVITSFDSAEEMLNAVEAYRGNNEFWSAAQDYLMQEPDDPAFTRIDRMLLYAFTGMPELEVPGSGEGKQRLFELRTYESYSELTGLIKVMMFNDGEIELFKKVGLPAVFYGSAVAGGNLPQLTYMLVHDDAEAQQSGWRKFIDSPEWKALQAKDPYAGKKLVSKIEKTMLVATDYSQIK